MVPSASRGSRGLVADTPAEDGTRPPVPVSSPGATSVAPLMPLCGSLLATAVNETSTPTPSAQGATVAQIHLMPDRRRPIGPSSRACVSLSSAARVQADAQARCRYRRIRLEGELRPGGASGE